MPPNTTNVVYEETKENNNKTTLVTREWLRERAKTDTWSAMDHLIWFNIAWFVGLHVVSLFGVYLLATFQVKFLSILFAVILYHISLFGITGGVHRLWSHRAFKARAPFRFMLVLMNSVAYQNSVYVWARDHRVHHKYSETNADPVNIDRGFFFAHCGWLLCKKHPDVREFGGRVDMSDIIADPFVYYQHKYYIPSVVLLCIALPTVIPWYLWGESFWISFAVCFFLRYTLALNSTWLVNSAAHVYGNRPYDVNIAPSENKLVAGLTLGEGYHNYHHTFPWDYSTSEWGWNINLTTFVLDQMAKIGQVYDRRFATKDLIKARKERTGNTKKYIPVELGY